MNKQISFIIQRLLIFFFSFSMLGKHIIFDLGDVLIGTDKFSFAKDVGFARFIKYAVFDFKNPQYVQTKVFNILDELGTQKAANNLVATYNDRALPEIMCRWLSGTITRDQVLQETQAKIDELFAAGFFCSKREKNIMQQVINTMFDPVSLAKNTYVIPDGIKLITDIIYHYGGEHDFYILSNWDPYSYDLLRNQPHLQCLFSYFQEKNIYISGQTGHIKPDPIFFGMFLQHYDLDPAECIFIDDQLTNILGAQVTGITGIQARKDNYKTIEKQLFSFLETTSPN